MEKRNVNITIELNMSDKELETVANMLECGKSLQEVCASTGLKILF